LRSLQGRVAMLPMRFISDSRGASAVPTGLGSISCGLTQDFRPFGCAQGRLWAIVCRRSATGVSFAALIRELQSQDSKSLHKSRIIAGERLGRGAANAERLEQRPVFQIVAVARAVIDAVKTVPPNFHRSQLRDSPRCVALQHGSVQITQAEQETFPGEAVAQERDPFGRIDVGVVAPRRMRSRAGVRHTIREVRSLRGRNRSLPGSGSTPPAT
jgi:hypothetical protein